MPARPKKTTGTWGVNTNVFVYHFYLCTNNKVKEKNNKFACISVAQ